MRPIQVPIGTYKIGVERALPIQVPIGTYKVGAEGGARALNPDRFSRACGMAQHNFSIQALARPAAQPHAACASDDLHWRARALRGDPPDMLAKALISLIRVYQLTLSKLMGPVCRFEPSCSRYAAECLRLHGAGRGSWLAVRRICRCHPFHPGGYDPPPLP